MYSIKYKQFARSSILSTWLKSSILPEQVLPFLVWVDLRVMTTWVTRPRTTQRLEFRPQALQIATHCQQIASLWVVVILLIYIGEVGVLYSPSRKVADIYNNISNKVYENENHYFL